MIFLAIEQSLRRYVWLYSQEQWEPLYAFLIRSESFFVLQFTISPNALQVEVGLWGFGKQYTFIFEKEIPLGFWSIEKKC